MANGVASDSFLMGVFRVFEAGERLLVDHAELVRLESREKLVSFATRFGLVAVGTWFLLTAWLGLLATAIVAFDELPLAARIGLASLAQLAVGIGMLVAARRAKHGDGNAT
jgi:hypothetical protein